MGLLDNILFGGQGSNTRDDFLKQLIGQATAGNFGGGPAPTSNVPVSTPEPKGIIPGLLGKIPGGFGEKSSGIAEGFGGLLGQLNDAAGGLASEGRLGAIAPNFQGGVQSADAQRLAERIGDAQISRLNQTRGVGSADSPFGKIPLGQYTPESLAKYQDGLVRNGRGNFNDLELRPDVEPAAIAEDRYIRGLRDSAPTEEEGNKRVDEYLSGRRAPPSLVQAPGAGTIAPSPQAGGPPTTVVTEADTQQGLADRAGAVKESSTTAGLEATEEFNLPQRVAAAKTRQRDARSVIVEIERGLGLVSPKSTGAVGAILQFIPHTDAFAIRQAKKTVLANVSLGKLAQMRDQSEDGSSGLGQLNKFEFEALQASIVSLEQAQTPGSMKRAMTKVLTHYENIITDYDQVIFESEARLGADTLAPGFSVIEGQ